MSIPDPVTREWLLDNCKGVFLFHLNAGDHHSYGYAIRTKEGDEFIGLMMSKRNPKTPKSKTKGGKFWVVEGIDNEFVDLDDALVVLNRKRRNDAADAEFEGKPA